MLSGKVASYVFNVLVVWGCICLNPLFAVNKKKMENVDVVCNCNRVVEILKVDSYLLTIRYESKQSLFGKCER